MFAVACYIADKRTFHFKSTHITIFIALYTCKQTYSSAKFPRFWDGFSLLLAGTPSPSLFFPLWLLLNYFHLSQWISLVYKGKTSARENTKIFDTSGMRSLCRCWYDQHLSTENILQQYHQSIDSISVQIDENNKSTDHDQRQNAYYSDTSAFRHWTCLLQSGQDNIHYI